MWNRPLAAESCDTPGACNNTRSTGALVPCGSASIAPRLSVSDVVPVVVKRLLRAASKLSFCSVACCVGLTVAGAARRATATGLARGAVTVSCGSTTPPRGTATVAGARCAAAGWADAPGAACAGACGAGEGVTGCGGADGDGEGGVGSG